MKENEEITNLERFELLIEDCKGHRELYGEFSVGEYDIEIMQHILSDYKRVLKENEELTISNKEIDKECSRLEKKEVELINENEHYKDLIYALKTYYDITEEDLEKCMKNDR